MSHKSILFSTRSSLILAEKIASSYTSYSELLGHICFIKFKDGEYEPFFEESVRGAHVFIIGSTFTPADNFMELLLICDAAHRSSATNITLVIPYFGWGRQDRKEKLRTPIGAKLVTNLIAAAGSTRVMAMDLHASHIQGFFEIPVDHIYAAKIFIEYLQLIKIKNLTIASTDLGGAKLAKSYASYLRTDIIICYKERNKANEIQNINYIGEVKNRNIIFIDDMIDTSGTLVIAANLIKKNGYTTTNLRAIITHPILSVNASEKIESSYLEELVVTDSITIKKKKSYKIKVLSCAALLSDVMHLVHNKESLRKYFIF